MQEGICYGRGEGMIKHIESIARTNRLHCSDCYNKIKKGEKVIFELDDCEDKQTQNVYCHNCNVNYKQSAIEDTQHPYDMGDYDSDI
jgi:protein-arginine kinase activator protein McsA